MALKRVSETGQNVMTPARLLAMLNALNRVIDALLGDITDLSGTYTPTGTNVLNLSASTPLAAQYIRVGNMVFVTGEFEATPTATGECKLGLSLPIASALTARSQLAGGAECITPFSTNGRQAAVYGDATNNRAEVHWYADDNGIGRAWSYSYGYQIL